MYQYLHDHLAAKVDPCKGRHPRPEQPFLILYLQLNPIGRLIMLVSFALVSNLRHHPVEYTAGECANSETHAIRNPHVTDLALGQLNPRQQLSCVRHAADFLSLAKVAPHHSWQFLAIDCPAPRSDEIELQLPAPEQGEPRVEHVDQLARSLGLAVEHAGLHTLGAQV